MEGHSGHVCRVLRSGSRAGFVYSAAPSPRACGNPQFRRITVKQGEYRRLGNCNRRGDGRVNFCVLPAFSGRSILRRIAVISNMTRCRPFEVTSSQKRYPPKIGREAMYRINILFLCVALSFLSGLRQFQGAGGTQGSLPAEQRQLAEAARVTADEVRADAEAQLADAKTLSEEGVQGQGRSTPGQRRCGRGSREGDPRARGGGEGGSGR